MDISYLGHSAFRLKTKGATVVMDPYSVDIGLKLPKISADIVTCSHDHADHNFSAGVTDVKKVLVGPGEYEVLDISFIGIASYHDAVKGEERGLNTVFVVEAEGLRLVHFGDLGHPLSERFYEKLGSIDIAFIPVGGHFTIDAQVAVDIIKTLEPKIVVPMHYQTQGLEKAIFEKLDTVDKFTNLLGQTVTEETKLSVTTSNIGEDQKVVVLSSKI